MSSNEEKLGGGFHDYMGFGVIFNHPDYVAKGLNVLAWGGLAVLFGWGMQRRFHDEADYSTFDTAARAMALTVMGMLIFMMLYSRCTNPRRGFTGIFKRATLDLLYLSSENPSSSQSQIVCGLNTSNFINTYSSNIRSYAVSAHLLYSVGLVATWFMLNDSETQDEQAVRMVANIDTLRTVVFLWIVVMPTVTTGLIDFAQVALANNRQPNSTPNDRHGRLWWSMVSIVQRALIYGVIAFLVDPQADHFFKHDSDSHWQTTLMIVATSVLGLMNASFWLMYHGEHTGHHDKPFAYTDFPATLCMIAAYSWLFSARLNNDHGPQGPGFDMVLMFTYLWAEFVGILNIPPATDFTTVQFTQSSVTGYSAVRSERAALTESGHSKMEITTVDDAESNAPNYVFEVEPPCGVRT